MENTVNNTISVERVLSLQQTIDAQKVEMSAKDREIGSLESQIDTLEVQISEIKSKQPEVRVVKNKPVDTWFGQVQQEDTIEYRNLDSVKLDIEKVMDKKYKSDLEKLEKELKDTKKSLANILEDKDDNIQKARRSYESLMADNNQNYNLRKDELEREFKDKASKKDLKIKELQEELQKVKEDKTDEQLEKLRTEEIATLKLEIKTLKKQFNDLLGKNVFKRTWLALTNKAVRVAAEKEIQEKEVELRKNRDEQENLNRFKRMGKGLMEQICVGSYYNGTYPKW